jgi:hypothetical protein
VEHGGVDVAYFNLLASVPEADVERLRGDPAFLLRPTLVSGCSHLLASWVEAQPLGGLLARALDGGEVIRPELWHPLRPPLVHGPAAVRELAEQVGAAVARESLPEDDWLAAEAGRLLQVLRHAAAAGECVVSVLDPPADAARADRVRRLWPAPQYTPNPPLPQTPPRQSFLGWLRSLVRRCG